MSGFTTRIIKGGALLAETRRLLEVWDSQAGTEEVLRRLRSSGAFGKTQARQEVVLSILRRRVLDPGPEVPRTLRLLADDPRAFREACYYETARTDGLLAACASGPLLTWHNHGRSEITTRDVVRWLVSDSRTPPWGPQTRERVARGLLSTLRDFGFLEGAPGGRRKRVRPAHLSLRGFAYVALRQRPHLPSDRALLRSPAWRWFLLSEEAVRKLLLGADRARFLRFSEAGSVIRIDWFLNNLEEVAGVAVA